jgi:cation diffusion facilitator CzcD-associated flavoprotein CzcO
MAEKDFTIVVVGGGMCGLAMYVGILSLVIDLLLRQY